MATTFKCLISLLFLILIIIIKGSCECSFNNITIGTTRSGRTINGKAEWNVEVINSCSCQQSQIKLSCKGFETVESVDALILSKKGDVCLVNNGNSLKGFASVSFSYAWDPPFVFWPSSSLVGACG